MSPRPVIAQPRAGGHGPGGPCYEHACKLQRSGRKRRYTSHGEKRCVWPAAEAAGVCPDGVQSANACGFGYGSNETSLPPARRI